MCKEHVDILRSYIDCFPELGPDVRWSPPRIQYRGRWRRLVTVRKRASGLELGCSGGINLRFVPTAERRKSQKPTLLKLIKSHFSPCRLLKVLEKTDRTRHQTAAILRVWIQRNAEFLAVLAVYEQESSELTARLLTALLLWWEELGRTAKRKRAAILIPERWTERVIGIFPLLRLPVVCYKYRLDRGELRQIYPHPAASAEVRSPYVIYPMAEKFPDLLARIRSQHPALDLVFRRGRWELSYLGLPVVWVDPGRALFFDSQEPKPVTGSCLRSLEAHLAEVFYLRSFPPPEADHFYYRFGEERWLESLVMQNHRKIEPEFCDEIYCQVPTWVEGDRKVLDLLTVNRLGRLAVLELKVGKDLSLILQGLDYWERVRHHLRRGDFQKAGYFPGTELAVQSPLLYLFSPLFEFHQVLPVVKKHLNPAIEITCIGINTDWKSGLRLLRRFEL
jgi:hypothetical protein